jgi:regulator of protease activity HflC (stomatin/prohibitin superfamily)
MRFGSNRGSAETAAAGIIVFVVLAAIVGGLMAGIPHYRVFMQNKRGEAMLREQEWTKQVMIEEAKAKKESAALLADAEIERAKGVAEANEIIGASLKDNEGYLRYLWIQGLQDGTSEVIYVPTEAQLPLLEAGKR